VALLISITGGPDLTLYEVDEAATRIREEVDAEANIILGATFDETLEGTMRVSVVATGLAEETDAEVVAKAGEEYDTVSGRLVYGFSGTRAAPVAHPAEEQPAEAAPQHVAAPAAQRDAEPAIQRAAAMAQRPSADGEQTLDTAPRAQRMAPRMPRPEEFPPIAQRQMQAHQAYHAQGAAVAEQPQKKRRGLIERLASVGLGRREHQPAASRPQPAPAPEPVAAPRNEPRMQAIPEDNRATQAGNVHPITPSSEPSIDPALDDDQLEIPAFLRRQAN
jgi:cell division protein FtsZ